MGAAGCCQALPAAMRLGLAPHMGAFPTLVPSLLFSPLAFKVLLFNAISY